MGDVGTVVWKELREHFLRRGMPTRAVWAALVLVVLAGLALPLVMAFTLGRFLGPEFVVSAVALAGVFAMAAQGAFGTMGLIVDVVAGERERHTLETLLAGPLPDRAILAGKMLAILGFAGIACLVVAVAQQVELLILYGGVGFGYAGAIIAGPAIGVLSAALVAAIGTLVSIRSATVKSGQQVLSFILMPLFLMPGLLQPLLTGTEPGRAILRFYDEAGPAIFVLVTCAILAALDALLFALARRAFRRDRLIHRKSS